MRRNRVLILAAALTVIATACAGGPAESGPANPENTVPEGTSVTTTSPTGSNGGTQSALELFAGAARGDEYPASLPPPTVDTSALLRGQIPDGIPAIDTPEFVDVAGADQWLEDDEGVVVLDIGGDARAYPVQILIWHEIVNDVVGEVPVAITYCPLCNSAVSYERTVAGEVTTFGTSGLLFNSALVMYDRATESLWTHYNGEAIAGLRAGDRLEPISSPLLAWTDFKEAFPDGLVLDRARTGYVRSYGSNPYVDYDNPSGFPFLFSGDTDDRLGLQRRVAGVSLEGAAKAWTLEAISGGTARATHDRVGDAEVVIFWKSGQATALESGQIADGRDVGSVRVFRPEIEDRRLTFRADDGYFVDEETSSRWNVAGEAVEGPLAGSRLEPVNHLDTFWFAWFSYNPTTELVEG